MWPSAGGFVRMHPAQYLRMGRLLNKGWHGRVLRDRRMGRQGRE